MGISPFSLNEAAVFSFAEDANQMIIAGAW